MAVNQYKKDGDGPNAYKKGNRTNSKRNIAPAVKEQQEVAEHINAIKELTNQLKKQKKYKQADLYRIYNNLKEYAERQRQEDRPLTVSGLILASGVSKATWYEMAKGDYDYRLTQYMEAYSIDIDNVSYYDNIPYIEDIENNIILLIPYSEIIQKALLMQEEQTEERLYKNGRVGDIFALKSQHGWKEDATPQTVNQTLVIATEEQARKAIELLK